ncbi:MAG: hypothetical protein ABEJ68_10905 [Halobacteriaceae archaeon]
MRTSRDLLRALAAVLVVAASMALVTNVAAFRAATTPAHVVTDGQHASGPSSAGRERAADRDAARTTTAHRDADSGTGDDDGDADGRSRTGARHVTVVERTGAS